MKINTGEIKIRLIKISGRIKLYSKRLVFTERTRSKGQVSQRLLPEAGDMPDAEIGKDSECKEKHQAEYPMWLQCF